MAMVFLAGCRSASEHRAEADEVAYDIVREGQQAALGRTEPFTIETPAQTLRQRLLRGQGLPIADPVSLGTQYLEPLDHWPKDDYLQRERSTSAESTEPISERIVITIDEALQIAAGNSFEYQDAKESVYQAALSLDLQRDAFRSTLAGVIDDMFDYDAGEGTSSNTGSGSFSVNRRFENGLTIAGSIVVDLVTLLTGDRDSTLGVAADLSATLPLLAGSGKHIVREPLTQAERDVLYALWGFERFKRQFAVRVASGYLSVLRQADSVENARRNYESLEQFIDETDMLARAGKQRRIDVDEASQDLLTARDNYNSAQQSFEQTLDSFKITIGLPVDANIALDPAELTRLSAKAGEALQIQKPPADVPPPSAQEASEEETSTAERLPQSLPGRLEIESRRAIELALNNRLDMRTRIHRVVDAQRAVVIAGDALRPGLGLTVTGASSDSRDIEQTSSNILATLARESNYSVSLSLDLPWEKTAERNAYRNSLISLEQTVRSVQTLEDTIKQSVRDDLRTLEQTRNSYVIQTVAVQIAEQRIDSAKLHSDAGRGQPRDRLFAENALLDAKNALTNALVNYRIAELNLQVDMGVLQVNEKGIWREFTPE